MYFTEFKKVNSTQTISILNNQSIQQTFINKNIFKALPLQLLKTLVFTFKDQYLLEVFQGIIPDSGAAGVLTTN